MKISVCIPMYNEIQTVSSSADTLYREMSAISDEIGCDFEIIFSDDGSSDGCVDKLKEFSKDHENVILISSPVNSGKGAAVKKAVLASTGDIIIYTDCDLAYGTKIISHTLNMFDQNTDFILGSRNLKDDGYEGYSFKRKLASKIYIKIVRMISGHKYSDYQCGYKAIRGNFAREIFMECMSDGFAFDFEIIMLAEKYGLSIKEIPVKVINHKKSTVNLMKNSLRMIHDLFKIKSRINKNL